MIVSKGAECQGFNSNFIRVPQHFLPRLPHLAHTPARLPLFPPTKPPPTKWPRTPSLNVSLYPWRRDSHPSRARPPFPSSPSTTLASSFPPLTPPLSPLLRGHRRHERQGRRQGALRLEHLHQDQALRDSRGRQEALHAGAKL